MAVQLDTTLESAMDSKFRKPEVEIISSQLAESIPFDGSYLNLDSDEEIDPKLSFISTGEIFGTYIKQGSVYRELWAVFTDSNKINWSSKALYSSGNVVTSAGVELSDGNVGRVFIRDDGSTRAILVMTVTPAGEIIQSATVVASGLSETTNLINGITVAKLSDDSYIMTYEVYDGSDYYLKSRTSTDFLSWGSETSISISNLISSRAKSNPFLFQISDGQLLLFFDYEDEVREDGTKLTNIYMVTSSDSGTTWGSPEKVTNYTSFGVLAKKPSSAERVNGSIELAFTEEASSLIADDSTANWCGNDSITTCHYDSSTGYIYLTSVNTGLGTKACHSVVVMDTADWSVVRCYSSSSIPGFDPFFSENAVAFKSVHGEGSYVIIAALHHIAVIDDSSQTVTNYHFVDSVEYGFTKNVDYPDYGENFDEGIRSVWVDTNTGRLYMTWAGDYLYNRVIRVGYIDLTENPGLGNYSFTELISEVWDEYISTNLSMCVVPEVGSIFIAGTNNGIGRLKQFSISSGNEIKEYRNDLVPSFPYHGASHLTYSDNKIYFSFVYESGYSEEYKRGLGILDLSTQSCSYSRPTYSTLDDYGITKKIAISDGRIICAVDDGVAIYNPSGGSWELWDNESLPGLTPNARENPYCVEYIEDTQSIVAGYPVDYPTLPWTGVVMFSELGMYSQGKYVTGTYDSSWSFSSEYDLTQFNNDSSISIIIDEEDTLWASWIRQDGEEYSLKWDNEATNKDLSGLIVKQAGVHVGFKIKDRSTLEFTCAKGNLLDPHNLLSTWNSILSKGRKISLRFGERIGGTTYWQKNGDYIVVETKIKYKRGIYPEIKVVCEDQSAVYSEGKIIASPYYSDQSPETIIENVLTTFGNLETENLDIPVFDTSHTVNCQFIEETVEEAIEELLNHFGYFPYWSVDGKYSPRKVDLKKSPDHIYVDTKLIGFTPDDSFSSFVNEVIVKGESKDLIEVLHPEELVGQAEGSLGWWRGTETKDIYFSEDHEKQCRDARLNVITSIKEFEIFRIKGGGDEYISYFDPNELYVTVTIEGPDFVWLVITNLAALVAVGYASSGCDEGFYCGAMLLATNLLLNTLLYSISAVASYQYEIWAKPVGQERQTVQGRAEDIAFKRYLKGTEIIDTIDDPYCYTVNECDRVAEYELSIVKAQRKRVSFQKIAHLADEVGDIIRVQHPDSKQDMDIFITELDRKFELPKGKEDKVGFTDTITGWRLDNETV